MVPITTYTALIKQVATRAAGILKVEWRGDDSMAAGAFFLQVHNSAVTVATGAVPIKSYPISTATEGYKEFKHGELELSEGCFVGVSSTEGTYTAATGTDGFDYLSVELCDPQVPAVAALSTAGDLTSAVTGLSVWSEATGAATPKKLVTLEVDATNNADVGYIMLFAKDSPSDGDKPVFQKQIAAAATLTKAAGKALQFGGDGRSVEAFDTALRQGCCVRISSTPTTLTLITGGNTCRIKAWYK